MPNQLKIAITGDHDIEALPDRSTDGTLLEWLSLPLLKFERLPLPQAILEPISSKPFQWVVFTSPRAVRFFTSTLVEASIDLPIETQVACIGRKTAEIAELDGYTPDFYPTDPGSEAFLIEFQDMLSNTSERPTILIPSAEAGRPTLAEGLEKLGCVVTRVPLYRTTAVESIEDAPTQRELEGARAVVFTSPSSYDAFSKHYHLPTSAKVVSLGTFTGAYLASQGLVEYDLVPQGDLALVSEVL